MRIPTRRLVIWMILVLAPVPACKTPSDGADVPAPAPASQSATDAAPQTATPAPRLAVTKLVNVFEEKREALLEMVDSSLSACRVAPTSGTELLVTLLVTGQATVQGLDEEASRCVAGELGRRVIRQEEQEVYFRANGSKVGTMRLKVP